MALRLLSAAVWTLAVIQASRTDGQLTECEVDCYHFGTTPGDMTADPLHCNMYYVCYSHTEWSPYSFYCPEGEMFDTVANECMAEGYTCSDPCLQCSFTCDNPILGYASDPNTCLRYYSCDGIAPIPYECPPESPFFDGSICQKDADNCCACKPLCTEEDAANHNMVPDRSNCTNFYLCLVAGVPDDTSHGHCPSGNFDATVGGCVEGAPCVEDCTNDPGAGDCVDTFTCVALGVFPRCTERCDPIYYICDEGDIGAVAEEQSCSHGTVFDPNIMMCLSPKECTVKVMQ